MATQYWNRLPSINIVEILSYLSLTDRLNATATCRGWRNCLFHPSLWRRINFRVKNGSKRRAKHLADMCGRFVRQAVIEFNSQNPENVRECRRILSIFGSNANMEKLSIKPTSCQVEWPKSDGEEVYTDRFVAALEAVICRARGLQCLALGCLAELTDHADILLMLLVEHQAASLQALHLSSVKEDPDSYGLIEFPIHQLAVLTRLRVLGIDYDYLSKDLLDTFLEQGRVPLEKLIIHVHGIEPSHEKIPNHTWAMLVKSNPSLEVTLSLIHSLDGATSLLDILRPAMPLAHLRMFFCQQINLAAMGFIAQHMGSRLRSLHIVDGMIEGRPNIYQATLEEEDPFVMLAWRCPNLTRLALIGYNIDEEDIVAIARLRGQQLRCLEVPLCCIATIHTGDGWARMDHGIVGSDFNREVSRSLGRYWTPVPDHRLHRAVWDSHANAEDAYLSILLRDQAW